MDLFDDKFDMILDKMTSEDKIAYLAGDFNINILNHNEHYYLYSTGTVSFCRNKFPPD